MGDSKLLDDDETSERQRNSRIESLRAACFYLKTLELPPVSYRDEDNILAIIDAFENARDDDAREAQWRDIRRYLRRLDGSVSDSEVFEYYARREFNARRAQQDASERCAEVAARLSDESAFRNVPFLRNYALNLAAATTRGNDLEAKRDYLIETISNDENASFLLSEYTLALDDYGFADVEEVERYCDELTDFLRAILLKGTDAAAAKYETSVNQAPRPECESNAPSPRANNLRAVDSRAPLSTPSESSECAPVDVENRRCEKIDGYYPISEELARLAQEANSLREYTPLSATREYRSAVDAARAVAARQKEKVGEEFYSRIDAVLDAYERKLAVWYDKFHRNSASCPSILVAGPDGALASRRAQKTRRVGELLREHEKIKELLSTLEGIGTGGISSDDERALEKLEARLAKLKILHEQMKEANAYRRKRGSWDGYSGPLKGEICVDGPEIYQYFNLPNSLAEIRRIEQRIELLNKRDSTDYGADVAFQGGVVRFNKSANRLQLVFDEKPDASVRSKIKKRGFKWAPGVGAWQRMLTADAVYAAKDLGFLPESWKPRSGGEFL